MSLEGKGFDFQREWVMSHVNKSDQMWICHVAYEYVMLRSISYMTV